MSIRPNENCTVIVLAGGQGMRMGSVGRLNSKASLVVYNQVLLLRLIEQITHSEFEKVIISTNHKHYDEIIKLVDETNGAKTTIKVIANDDHEKSALHAFKKAIVGCEDGCFLLVLADIYFFDNPFVYFSENLEPHKILMGVAVPDEPKELSMGGVVQIKDNEITLIKEKPSKAKGTELRWSGLTLLSKDTILELENFLSSYTVDTRIGDFFEYCRQKGYLVSPVIIPDFININSPEYLLLASMCNYLEKLPSQDRLRKLLETSIAEMRNHLAENATSSDTKHT